MSSARTVPYVCSSSRSNTSQHVAAQVLPYSPLDFLVEILDFLVVEEVQRRVEIVDGDEPFAFRRSLLLHLAAHRGGSVLAPSPPGVARPRDRGRPFFRALDRDRVSLASSRNV